SPASENKPTGSSRFARNDSRGESGGYTERTSSSDRTWAFLARLRARAQSPACAASRASLRKPLILETRSDCDGLNFLPRVAARFFSATLRLSFVSCCAAADSCCVSCGEIGRAHV